MFLQAIQEFDEFLMRTGKIYQTLQRLAQNLDRSAIEYALIGGMALVAHGYVRATEDVDVLLSPEGLEAFRQAYLGRGYVSAFPGAAKTFRDTQTGGRIEIITSGEYPGDGKPKSVQFPHPHNCHTLLEGIWVISLPKLIELKLASGLSAPERLKDLADVQELIRVLNLELDLVQELDLSVQNRYRQLWESIHPSE